MKGSCEFGFVHITVQFCKNTAPLVNMYNAVEIEYKNTHEYPELYLLEIL